MEFPDYIQKRNPKTGKLPVYRLKTEGLDRFLYDDDDLAEVAEKEGVVLDGQEDVPPDKKDNGKKNSAKDVDLVEFFEARELEKEILKLEKFKMKIEDYERNVPADDKEKPKPLYSITDGEDEKVLFSVREILETVMESGRKGMTITRYKGLGEMNPAQLWETTMDPERRTVLKVILNDVVAADKMFTVLMGDQVEPRREFIERYAREVRDLDV